MNKLDRLKNAYGRHIRIPWRADTSPEERVIFCTYPESDELSLRVRLDEFAQEAKQAGHRWENFDLTDTFASWLTSQKYKENYFKKPHLMQTALDGYSRFVVTAFEDFLARTQPDVNTVVAITGVGSVFGFLKVRDVVASLAPLVSGRLVVFFPGTHENNNYRLFDAYDGWNYLAIPISADSET